MNEIEIRTLRDNEVRCFRELAAVHPDRHTAYVLERFPRFFEMCREYDRDSAFQARQQTMIGAFANQRIVGGVAIERVSDVDIHDFSTSEAEVFWSKFTEHDCNVYDTLNQSLARTFIGAPKGTLTVHCLSVAPEYRRRGIARSLISHAIDLTSASQRTSLHIQFARLSWLVNLGASLGFTTIRRTFSISQKLEYGCWGSVLMRYSGTNGG